jgi:hypothetical protein
MKRVWTGATAAFAVACAVALAAQTSTSSSTSQKSDKSAGNITVTGCLEKGTEPAGGATGTTGTAGSASSARGGEWVLKNATMGPGGGSYSSTGSTGSTAGSTAGTPPSSMSGSGSNYILEGKSDELSKHAGHKVEVTGRLDSSSSGSSSTTSTTGSTASSSVAGGQKLHVESVRMISADCSSK